MSENFFTVRCDNCGREFPLLYALHLFCKDWHICAACCNSLRLTLKNQAPHIPEPYIPIKKRSVA